MATPDWLKKLNDADPWYNHEAHGLQNEFVIEVEDSFGTLVVTVLDGELPDTDE